ncbi:MAG: DUF2155 domain-containing protein [Xanthobacteraceae bacterium]
MAHTALKAALIAGVTILGATAAIAQFGSIFGDPPPRPPGAVPGGRQMPAPPQDYYPPPPPQDYSYPPPSRANPPPQGYPPQSRQYPTQQGPYGPYGGVQSQPLPPPGANPPAARAPAGQAPVTGLPPVQRQPKAPPKTAVTTPPPSDETIAEPPPQKIANPTALFSGLDKITGRIINFDVAVGETVQFGALQLTTRACFTRPPTETANTDAFVEVDEVTLQGEVRRIFTGWMFAASPGLHAIEHPIYDLWLTDCKGGAQNVASDTTATQSNAQEPPAKPRAKPRPKQPQRAQPRQLPQQGYPPFR